MGKLGELGTRYPSLAIGVVAAGDSTRCRISTILQKIWKLRMIRHAQTPSGQNR
jgi:hypothetical protein